MKTACNETVIRTAARENSRVWLCRTKSFLDWCSGILCLLGILALCRPAGDARTEMLCGIVTVVCMSTSFLFDFFACKLDCSYGAHRCKHCGHVHMPEDHRYVSYTGSCSRRYLQCPACGKKSWHTKVLEDME